MTKITCDACGKPIRDNTAAVLVNTATSSQRWHVACCPLIQAPAPEAASEDRKARAA